MQVDALISYARLWSSEALHEQVDAWVQGEGKTVLELSSSQFGGLERLASSGMDELYRFLDEAAKPNRPAAWRQVKEKLPHALAEALKRGRGGNTTEAEAYRRLKGKILDSRRDTNIQRDFLSALSKAYRRAKEQR